MIRSLAEKDQGVSPLLRSSAALVARQGFPSKENAHTSPVECLGFQEPIFLDRSHGPNNYGPYLIKIHCVETIAIVGEGMA